MTFKGVVELNPAGGILLLSLLFFFGRRFVCSVFVCLVVFVVLGSFVVSFLVFFFGLCWRFGQDEQNPVGGILLLSFMNFFRSSFNSFFVLGLVVLGVFYFCFVSFLFFLVDACGVAWLSFIPLAGFRFCRF